MIKLKIKIKGYINTFTHDEFLPEEYNVSKDNADLQHIVDKACKDSHIEDIQDVLVTAKFEW